MIGKCSIMWNLHCHLLALEDEGTEFPQEVGYLMQLYNKNEQNPQLHHSKSFKTLIVWAARRMSFPIFLDHALKETILCFCLSLPYVRILVITAFCDRSKLVSGRFQISARLLTILTNSNCWVSIFIPRGHNWLPQIFVYSPFIIIFFVSSEIWNWKRIFK